jgi:hypothetical protein
VVSAVRKVLISEELFVALGADRVEWGEPDTDGFYTPTLFRRDTKPTWWRRFLQWLISP